MSMRCTFPKAASDPITTYDVKVEVEKSKEVCGPGSAYVCYTDWEVTKTFADYGDAEFYKRYLKVVEDKDALIVEVKRRIL